MAKSKLNKPKASMVTAASLPLWQKKYFFEFAVFLFAFLLFANSIPNNYNLDDELVTINHRLTSKGISAIPDIFVSPYYQDESGYSYEYRPVVLASFAIEHEFFGDNPHASHFFNVLLYALCCALLYRVLIKLFKGYSTVIALVVSVLFVAHTAHTEVVCSIKNRDELLALFFGLLVLYVILEATQKSRKWMILSVLPIFTLAIMSKVTAVAFAVIIPLALILFSDSRYKTIFLITILLLIPTCFMLTVISIKERLLFSIAVLVTMSLFFVIANFKDVVGLTRPYFERLVHYLSIRRSLIVLNKLVAPEEYSLTGIFKGVLPNREVLSPVAIIITGFLAFLYFYSIHVGYLFYASMSVVILLIFAWRGSICISWWAQVMIFLMLTINLIFYTTDMLSASTATYIKIVNICLAYHIFFGERKFFLPALICFLLFNYFNYKITGEYTGLFFLLIPILINKYVRFFLLIMIFARIVNMLFIHVYNDMTDMADLLSSLILIIVIQFRTGGKIILWIAIILSFALFLKDQSAFGSTFYTHIDNLTDSTAISKITPYVSIPSVVSKKENRPLEYVENCVNLKSPFTLRAGTSLEILFCYLGKVVVPYPLSFYYGYKFIRPQKLTDTIPVLSLILHFFLLITGFIFFRKEKLIGFGIFIYLITIAIFSNYILLVPGMVADRLLLIPSLGWIIVLVAVLWKLHGLDANLTIQKWGQVSPRGKYLFGAILTLYSVATFSRNIEWKDYLTLFRHDVKYVENSAQAHNLIAVRLVKVSFETTDQTEQAHLRKEAIGHFEKAIRIYPDFFNVAYDIGRTYTLLNMTDSAISGFKRALVINPAFSDCYMAIGELYFQQNKIEQAIPYYQFLIDTYPNQYLGYDKVSFMYFLLKKYDMSVHVNQNAIKQMPNQPQPYITLGKIYRNLNMKDSSRIWIQKALEVSPGNSEALTILKQIGK